MNLNELMFNLKKWGQDEDFDEIEFYYGKKLHTDYCDFVESADVNAEIKDWEIMDEDRYNETICANCDYADFDFWYGNKETKVLVILFEGETK